MGTMGLADLANYYWLGERVLTVANECARRGECASASGASDCGARVRTDRIRTSIYSRAVAKKMH